MVSVRHQTSIGLLRAAILRSIVSRDGRIVGPDVPVEWEEFAVLLSGLSLHGMTGERLAAAEYLQFKGSTAEEARGRHSCRDAREFRMGRRQGCGCQRVRQGKERGLRERLHAQTWSSGGNAAMAKSLSRILRSIHLGTRTWSEDGMRA